MHNYASHLRAQNYWLPAMWAGSRVSSYLLWENNVSAALRTADLDFAHKSLAVVMPSL